MMKPYKNIDKLISLAEAATKDPEIVKGMFDSHLTLDAIKAEIRKNETVIWDTAASELTELGQLEHLINRFEDLNEKYLTAPKDRYAKAFQLKFIPIGLAVLMAALLFRPIISIVQLGFSGKSDFNWAWTWESFAVGALVFLIILGGSWLFILILYQILSIRNKRYLKRLPRDLSHDKYESWKTRYADLTRLTNSNVQEKGIRELIRSMINERLKPLNTLSLSDIEGKGLAEVIDLNQTIDSIAKHRLDFLLANMPGGSVGIAGPRGAGKTTLLQTYCRQNRSGRNAGDKKVLGTLVSAPVKYDPRDFILHLFSAVCFTLLRDEGRLPDNLFNDELRRHRRPPHVWSYRWLLRLMPPIAMFLGIFFLLSSFYLHSWHIEFQAKSTVDSVTLKTDSLAAKIGSAPGGISDTTTKKPGVSVTKKTTVKPAKVINIRPDSTLSFYNYYRYQVSKNSSAPVSAFNWGVGMIALSLVLLFVLQRQFVRSKIIRERGWALERSINSSSPTDSAIGWLKRIKFQQSFTTGWSGSIKLPIALEGGLSQDMTLAENQMSNPDIITAFTDFLTQCTATHQVIIGIDELDKMASEEDAKLFLNEIKSIFGIPRVFYLISVSENAMNNFERRGMPIRDVFDSSFDSIIFVDYLDISATQLLLQRRIVGKPIPFFNLAFCLGGGLPRDVIRYFRQILELAVQNRDLNNIVQRLVTSEVNAKIRALLPSLQQLSYIPGSDKMLDMFYIKPRASYSAADLEVSIAALSEQLKELSEIVADPTPGPERRALVALVNETRSYFAYISTLLSMFSLNDEVKIIALETNGDMQELGSIRQLLAVDHDLSFKRTLILRKKIGLKILSH